MEQPNVIIAQSSESYLDERQLLDDCVKTIDTLTTKILEDSNKLEKAKLTSKTLVSLLEPFLQEFEVKFDDTKECDSVEIAINYVELAKYVKAHFDRDDCRRIGAIQDWIDNQPVNG
jgi:hypothetical protein